MEVEGAWGAEKIGRYASSLNMYITMDINHSQCTKRDSDTTV